MPLPAIADKKSSIDSTITSPVAPPSKNNIWSLACATVPADATENNFVAKTSTPILLITPPSEYIISSAAISPVVISACPLTISSSI